MKFGIDHGVANNEVALCVGENCLTTLPMTIAFKCYICEYMVDNKDSFLQHVKLHKPNNRSSADAFLESSFTMIVPTESRIACIEALQLYRQGDQNSLPAV